MIFTQYGAPVTIVAKEFAPGNEPDMPGLVQIEFSDGERRWRTPWQLRADGGIDEIKAAAANVPKKDSSNN
jgi:hypothetical protein